MSARDLPNDRVRRSLVGVQFHRTNQIVGEHRPHRIAHLVLVSLTTIFALQGVAAPATATPARAGTCAAATARVAKASTGLLMPSESDAPFTPFTWRRAATPRLTTSRLLALTGHTSDTPVESVDLRWFFRNVAFVQPWHDPQQAHDVERFRRLLRTLERSLTDVRVYRVGTIRIDAYIVGRCGRDLIGLSTVLVEA